MFLIGIELSKREAAWGSSATLAPAPSVSVTLRSITVLVSIVHSNPVVILEAPDRREAPGLLAVSLDRLRQPSFARPYRANMVKLDAAVKFPPLTSKLPPASALRRRVNMKLRVPSNASRRPKPEVECWGSRCSLAALMTASNSCRASSLSRCSRTFVP